ncbi:MAG TPA: hypothetical protein VKG44_11470, partial [Candidatus Baltobacteraceae bacterium]|nr:hypothetical protein [Candidatus Baltobacteraceae bacterium]
MIAAGRIVRLQPREESFHVAVDAYRSGRLDVCLSGLHSRDDAAAVTLRGRALLRLGQAPAAVSELSALDRGALPAHLRGELGIVLGAALTLVGKAAEARAVLDETRVWAYSSGAEMTAEFEYYDMFWHWASGDLAAARAAALRGLEVGADGTRTEDYVSSLPAIRARHLEALGGFEAAHERYPEQAAFLRQAIDELDAASVADVWVTGSVLSNLAMLVRELDLGDDDELVMSRYAKIPRTAYTMPFSFHIFHSLAWCKALRGDHLGAFRDLREASGAAFAPALQLCATADRALLADRLGQRLTARDELERAQDLAARIDWENVAGDYRTALLPFAQALAPFRPRAARTTLERYQQIRAKLSPLLLANVDRRLRADELFTEGTVAKAEDNEGGAVRAFLDAFEIWDEIGFRWRAALAAIELSLLTRDSRYTGYAAAEAAKRPASWLAERLRAAGA